MSGGERHLLRIAKALTERGHHVRCAARTRASARGASEMGLTADLVARPPLSWMGIKANCRVAGFLALGDVERARANLAADDGAASDAPEVLRNGRPSTTFSSSLLAAPLAPLLDRVAIPILASAYRTWFEAQQFDVVIGDLPWDQAALTLARRGTKPRLVWFLQSSDSPGSGERLAMRESDCVIACSQGVRALRARDRADVLTIENGIDVNLYRRPAAFAKHSATAQFPPNRFVLTFVGKVDPSKGIDILLEAHRRVLRSFPHCYLVLAGPISPAGSRALQRHRRPTVVALGSVSDIPQLLWSSDVFALPSRAEGLPLSLIEAMAAGLPCIGSDISGIREVARGDCVSLVEQSDVEAWRLEIERLCSDVDARRALANRGNARVNETFTFERNARRFGEAIEALQ